MEFTSYITISRSNRISSDWEVVSHKYDPAVSEHRVEKIVLNTFSIKNEAARSAIEESKKSCCSFVYPGQRVVTIKVGDSSSGKTYQVVELMSEGDVKPLSEMFSTPIALRGADSLRRDQSGLSQCATKADLLAMEQKMIFVPAFFMVVVAKGLSVSWRQLLIMGKEKD